MAQYTVGEGRFYSTGLGVDPCRPLGPASITWFNEGGPGKDPTICMLYPGQVPAVQREKDEGPGGSSRPALENADSPGPF
jgi:hypothetical protein